MIFTYIKQPLHKYTFEAPKIKKWVENLCKDKVVLNLFAGPTRINGCKKEYTNDLDEAFNTSWNLDALDCVTEMAKNGWQFERIILDPPYSYRKSMEKYNGNLNSRFKKVLDEIPKILTPGGLVITFGYHSRVMSSKRGFRIREICLISHGGAQHDTIATVEERINKPLIVVEKEKGEP
jgi:tRNA G10  N-methylase Trm11